MNRQLFAIVAFAALSLSSACKKNTYSISGGNGITNIVFSNNAGSNSLVLGQTYTNEHGDEFQLTAFKYYISNIKLNGSGVSYTEPESYHLIDQNAPAGSSFQLNNIPYGQYTSITFTVGVDSARNVSGAQTGALDPVNNMFWSWSTGYVMLKAEGTSPQSTQVGHAITFHAAGFHGMNSALRTVTVGFPHPINVTGDPTSINNVHVVADMLAMFKSPNVIDFSTTSSVQTEGPQVSKLADNYANMFSVVSSGL